jgi:two-component system, OmpR family, sensor histidine kinase MprB
MTLRLRMAAIAAFAVTAVVAVLAFAVYLAVRSDLRGEVDRVLAEQAQPLGIKGPGLGSEGGGIAANPAPPGAPPQPKLAPSAGAGSGASRGLPAQAGLSRLLGIAHGPPQPFAGAGGYIQAIAPDGAVAKSPGEGALASIPPSTAARAIAASGTGRNFEDVYAQGEHMRVLTIGAGAAGAVQLARPLTEIDRELSDLVVILLAVGGAGVLLAALLGAVVARAALAPIARFTRRTEGLAASVEATERLPIEGRDELARLAGSFNRTLDELERSVQSQRQLVADASHELRTPIASLRANIEVLRQVERLSATERGSLLADVIAELDELTRLVSDLVELARGVAPSAVPDEVRLDEIVRAAITRAQRRPEQVAFHVEIEPTLVCGDATRVDRAVANVLDNAMKWSPPGSVIDVSLHDGVLSVRDHGPGFGESDLPHVFARFYRADEARGKPGSGLGLAIVKQAVEAHNGHVEAANAPGGGARVAMTFGAPTQLLRASNAELMHA